MLFHHLLQYSFPNVSNFGSNLIPFSQNNVHSGIHGLIHRITPLLMVAYEVLPSDPNFLRCPSFLQQEVLHSIE